MFPVAKLRVHMSEGREQMWNQRNAVWTGGGGGILPKILCIEEADENKVADQLSVSLFVQLGCLDTILKPRGAQSAVLLFVLIF